MSGKMFVSGQLSQTTKNVPNAKIRPVVSAPAKRMPSVRASTNAPRAPKKSFRAAITARESQNGRM